MKRQYFKPEIEILDILPGMQILAGSGGDFDDNKTGSGSNASDVENPLPGGGTRAPEFFGDVNETDY